MKAILVTGALMLAIAPPLAAQDKQTATADFIDRDGKGAGRAALTVAKEGVVIELEVSGLPANKWLAFHVHENGSCDAAGGFASAGAHFNSGKSEHGLLAANGPHAGDMPNQYVASDGFLRGQLFETAVTLDGKDDGIRGRALVIHAGSDDYRSQPSGGAGDRIACAIIK
ncbi:superoxide dismutase family protein [Rhizobium sp. BK251]|uniref:superoxide dismutase family protein n=1 Tax=Rhizobium sp. BK251 TaxID=2512125 RepID=UPI00104E72D8|nr:superoxide dismutase family protein [Rhizobium sp. BK251]TCL70187.1 Cu-Zn family superoxide dismutase [Rhizobium sp. BK251]